MHTIRQYNFIFSLMSGFEHLFSRLLKSNLLLVSVNVLLVAALAYKLSGLIFMYVDQANVNPGGVNQTTANHQIEKANNGFTNEIGRTSDTESISMRNLFGIEKSIPKKTIERHQTTLKLTLRGVFAVEDPTKGIAIIYAPDHFDKYFVAGQSVFEQATLKEIYHDHVVLFRNGRYETLYLPEDALKFKEKKRAFRKLNRDEYAKKHVEYMRGQMKDIHKMTLRRMRNPWQYVYFEPVMVDGKMMGLTFKAEEEKDFLNKHGIQIGDVVTSINGHGLDGGAGVAKALNEISQADNLDLVIDRKGKVITLHIANIQEHQQ